MFMEWGIINKENWEGKTTFDLPIKRWDPLSTVRITSEDFGLRKERIRYYGHYSYISPIRGTRPKGFKTEEEEKEFYDCSERVMKKHLDVFSSVTEGKQVYNGWGMPIGDGFTIIINQDEMRRDNPFLETPHQIERIPEASKALTLINRYPSMARIIDSEVEQDIKNKLPPQLKLSTGINLVTISRHFYPSLCFNLIPTDVIMGIFLSMKAAILYSIEEAIAKCPDNEECFVIGGGMIYRQFFKIADRLYITKVHKSFEADTFFPYINYDDWELVEKEDHGPEGNNNFSFSYTVYKRKLNFLI